MQRLLPALTLLALLLPVAPRAQEVGPNDFQITAFGNPGTTSQQAQDPAVAHNPTTDQYLVVFEGDSTDGLFEIYGQLVDGTGTNVGPPITISSVTSVSTADAFDPAVAYNSITNEFFVVYEADPATGGLLDNENEVFGQRISATGALIGSPIRVSLQGPDGNANFDATDPAVAYNPVTNEYLVVWEGDDTVDNRFDISGRLVTALGEPVGTANLTFSNQGPAGDDGFDAFDADVAFAGANTVAPDGYLVVFRSDDDTAPQIDGEYEVFAQYVSTTGAQVGDDLRISDAGTDGVTTFLPTVPTVACSPLGVCLVAWNGDDNTAPQVDNELEVRGQLLAADGTETGENDFLISNAGTPGNANIDTGDPAVAFNTVQNVFLVTWEADSDLAPIADGETEIFAEYISLTGMTVGASDYRVSDLGPDGDINYDAFNAAVAYNAVDDEFLVVWYGDDNVPPQVLNELEILGQRMEGSPLTTAGEPGPAPGAYRLTAATPNPFDRTTAFTLTLAEAGPVNVAVYNALGQRVAVLHDGPVTAGVPLALRLDGAGLAAGAYLVRVQGPDFAESLRVTLAR